MCQLEVCFDLPPKLPRLGIADVPFAARIGDGLPEQIDPATRTEKVCHGSADRCEWNALVDGDVVFGEVRSVYDDALRLLHTARAVACEMARLSGPRLALAQSTASRYCENRPGGK